MRRLQVRHQAILPLQRGSLRRHRWYVALEDARPTRLARCHAAAYRAMRRARAAGRTGFLY